MAASVNKVILIGNLGGDPEVRSMQNGEVCNLTIATSEIWKDKGSGERKERTQWHKVVIFNEPLIKVASNYLKKGSKVYVEGQLETRKWQDKEGKDQYTTEVVLRPYKGELTLLDGKEKSERQMPPEEADDMMHAHANAVTRAANAQRGRIDAMEDDIPFNSVKYVCNI